MSLLDSPLRTSLTEQSVNLRISLKEYERNFFATHSRKPGRDDIKQDEDVAAKYKQYNKIRDVLSGKVSKAVLEEASSPSRSRKRKSTADVRATPRKTRSTATPRKNLGQLRPDELDPYDAPSSVSPRPPVTALGPTPQRDGRVMGIFDMLDASGSRTRSSRKRKISALLPDTLLEESPARDMNGNIDTTVATARTPARTRSKSGAGDILDHLAGTPATGRRNKHSRTPASESRKFMLNQFFATPSAVRYASMLRDPGADELLDGPAMLNGTPNAKPVGTPLLDRVLKRTPAKDPAEEGTGPTDGERTPAYLKRSHSFKQRLLSASSSAAKAQDDAQSKGVNSPRRRSGPRHLIKSKYNPRTLSQVAQQIKDRKAEETLERSQAAERLAAEAAADDDELDALREIEVNDDVLIGDSQLKDIPDDAFEDDFENAEAAPEQPTRAYKKKGQKRTTRRVIMRPSKVKIQDPKYREDTPPDDQVSRKRGNPEAIASDTRVEETQLQSSNTALGEEISLSDDELLAEIFANSDDELFGVQKQQSVMKSPVPGQRSHSRVTAEEQDGAEADDDHADPNADADFDESDTKDPLSRQPASKKSKSTARATAKAKVTPKTTASTKPSTQPAKKPSTKKTAPSAAPEEEGEEDLPSRKINPNLQSHQNFRTLKIRNRNSKAGGKGRGRFSGKGRR